MSSSSKPAMKPYGGNPWRFFATSGGASCLPIPGLKLLPGTLGTLPAVLLWWLLAEVLGWHISILAGITVAIFVIGIPLTNIVCLDIDVHDDGRVTFDEIGGYFAAMTIANIAFNPVGIGWMFAVFGLFRFFDMVKPDPVWRFDRNENPYWSLWSPWIMLDDYVGGALAGLLAWGFFENADKAWALFGVYVGLTFVLRLTCWWAYKNCDEMPTPSLLDVLQGPPKSWDSSGQKERLSS